MTQDILKEYLEAHGCYLYKSRLKEDGEYFFMRKNGQITIAVLFPPKSGQYKPESVCHICEQLDVEVPAYATEAQARLAAIKQQLKNPK